ncbi:hypothetical protein ACHHYP_08763 [Achlya hypogyna]|uniref:Solanesyl diphosphate synthase n=1 Tax=Achlya hypogyna TaxID=1202772 RepID=A0A1V9ZK13_ACHHY|nr:hypothetical protein ACHHYP_08763 [Achlya hypogyna]
MQRLLRTGTSLRAYSSLHASAMKRVVGSLQGSVDIESSTTLWLGAAAVDEPTMSILDPSPGFTAATAHQSFDLTQDFDRYKPAPVGRLQNGEAITDCTYINTFVDADPFELIKDDIVSVSESIKSILGSDHPVLEAVAKYFFENDGGKKVRPTMILLLSQAAEAARVPGSTDKPLEYIAASQQRLAEVTEMIHTASLLHDDVIDEADTRRGMKSVNKVFGSKLSILAGDFLLARSSVCLARLRSLEAVELMSTAIEHLVKGEVMQMRHADKNGQISPFEYYLRKNYYKTGSLMANSCRAALLLGEHSTDLIDDVLDYKGQNTGKPMLADLKAGLATAPVLLAQEEFPVLKELAARKFANAGDIELAAELVEKSVGLQKSKDLAIIQAELAILAVMQYPPSPARDALVKLAQLVVTRSK